MHQSELRGALIKYLNSYTHNDDVICQTLASYGFNAVYLEVNPWSYTGNMIKNIPSFITACNKYGLELHILFLFFSGGYYTEYYSSQYPLLTDGSDAERMVNSGGSFVGWNCFQKAASRARVKNVIDTLMSNYGSAIADINFDYVRVPTSSEGIDSYSVCYCDECKAAFQAWLTQNGKTFTENWSDYYYGGSKWKDYAEWRCVPINNMIRDVRQWALAWKPTLKFSADVWSPYAGWTPDYYKEYMAQDTAYWVSQGWLDALNPMEYTNSYSKLQDAMTKAIQYWTGASKGAIPLRPFITQGISGAGVNPVSTTFWTQEIDYLRSIGCNGFIIWRYSGPGFNTGDGDLITQYLSTIQNSSAKGAFPVFTQSQPSLQGSNITWQTSLPTTGKVEYSSSPLFMATPKNGSRLSYVDMDYVNGTILYEPTPTQDHLITVPISPPFYFRIIDVDSNIELASPVYLNTG